MKWGKLEDLRPGQINDIKAKTPIAYVPLGAIEWHGVHNAVGLDSIKAHGLCCALAEENGGVVCPPVYFGTDTIKPFKGFGHTFDFSCDLVLELCKQLLAQIADEDYKVIVLITGHYGQGQMDAVREASEWFSVQYPHLRLHASNDASPVEGLFPPNHAAKHETAYQLYFRPQTVDLELLKSEAEITLDQHGVWGEDPREATADLGRRMTSAFVERMTPIIAGLLQEAT